MDIYVDNMCITTYILWINSTTTPLYVSGCARAGLSFLRSVTLWIAAFRWPAGFAGSLRRSSSEAKEKSNVEAPPSLCRLCV